MITADFVGAHRGTAKKYILLGYEAESVGNQIIRFD
jgi:hypothetical protein